MISRLLFTFSLLFFIKPAVAQEAAREKVNMAAAAYGAGPFTATLRINTNLSGAFQHDATGPIYLKYERRLTKNSSAGLNMYWMEDRYTLDYTDANNHTMHVSENHIEYGALMRYNQFVFTGDNFEMYTGFGIGFRKHKGRLRDESNGVFILESVTPSFPFAFELVIGERLYFSDRFGVFVEAGFAKSVLQGGVCYRIS
jgi:hypothetical protein